MQKELWLLRHGKSDRETDLADIDRPLKKRGEKNAFEMGSWKVYSEFSNFSHSYSVLSHGNATYSSSRQSQ